MKWLVAGILLLVTAPLLAGCSGKPTHTVITDDFTAPPTPQSMRIAGLVESDTLVPLSNATLTILESNATVRTNEGGRFEFPLLPPRIYTVRATLLGYVASDLVARPDTNAAALDFVLQTAQLVKATQDSLHFSGFFECGAEALIISGSCDALVQAVPPNQAVFQNQSSFKFPLTGGWATTVIDVVFDPSAQPALAGLRVAVRGVGDAAQLNTYQQYGRFFDAKSFTARLDPGKNYTDGEAPVTSNITAFALDVYPQSNGYHKVCDPTGSEPCLLGAGAGHNIEFDLYVTIFYVDPAPEGFTLRKDA